MQENKFIDQEILFSKYFMDFSQDSQTAFNQAKCKTQSILFSWKIFSTSEKFFKSQLKNFGEYHKIFSIHFKFFSSEFEKLSRIIVLYQACSKATTACDQMYQAQPVIRIVFFIKKIYQSKI